MLFRSSTAGNIYGKAGRVYISADYPGYLRRYVEQEDGHCRAAYFQGALGNVICVTTMQSVRNKWQPPQETERIGQRLGELALDAMKDMTEVPVGRVQSLRQEHVAFDRDFVGTTRAMEQDVVTLGTGVAFVTAGYEMFDINGMDVKNASPFPVTFICGCSQSHEYMPSWETFHYELVNGKGKYVAYEARPAQCNVVPGTGEDLAGSLLAMLNKLHRAG